MIARGKYVRGGGAASKNTLAAHLKYLEHRKRDDQDVQQPDHAHDQMTRSREQQQQNQQPEPPNQQSQRANDQSQQPDAPDQRTEPGRADLQQAEERAEREPAGERPPQEPTPDALELHPDDQREAPHDADELPAPQEPEQHADDRESQQTPKTLEEQQQREAREWEQELAAILEQQDEQQTQEPEEARDAQEQPQWWTQDTPQWIEEEYREPTPEEAQREREAIQRVWKALEDPNTPAWYERTQRRHRANEPEQQEAPDLDALPVIEEIDALLDDVAEQEREEAEAELPPLELMEPDAERETWEQELELTDLVEEEQEQQQDEARELVTVGAGRAEGRANDDAPDLYDLEPAPMGNRGESREDRNIFNQDRDHIFRQEAIDDMMRHTMPRVDFHKIILSPSEDEPVTNFRAWTRAVMNDLAHAEGKHLHWYAVIHRNTDNPHVHVVLAGRGENMRTGKPETVVMRDDVQYKLLRESGREHSDFHLYQQINQLLQRLDTPGRGRADPQQRNTSPDNETFGR